MTQRILVVEDKDTLRSLLLRVLGGEGWNVTGAASAEEASPLLKGGGFDAVVTDLRLPGADGHSVLLEAKKGDPRTEVVVLTAFGSIESSVRAVKAGAFDYLTKPVENEHLVRVVRAALENRRKAAGGPAEPGEARWVGESRASRECLALAEKAAASDATILLQGESGTGKELLARFIHRHSPRASQPFVSLNCGVLAPTLFESELFGHERGAFTGAADRKEGRFEAAGNGTLFLDEVSEIPLDSQVKLLRVLQEKEFERVGGVKTVKALARVLAATNRPLLDAVRRGAFREDLYYRLNVIPLNLPPLRRREGDVELLARTFLERFSREAGKPLSLAPEAIAALKRHPWPGNVRELEHCLHRAAILLEGDTIHPGDLRLEASLEVPDASQGPLKALAQKASETAERKAIQEALEGAKGNKSEAARRLQVGYKTLLNKIKELGLE